MKSRKNVVTGEIIDKELIPIEQRKIIYRKMVQICGIYYFEKNDDNSNIIKADENWKSRMKNLLKECVKQTGLDEHVMTVLFNIIQYEFTTSDIIDENGFYTC